MKTTSIIFTFLLVVPFGWTIVSAISSYYIMRIPLGHSHDLFILRGFAIGILYDLIVATVAIVLITKKNYYASTIMCGTVVFGFILYEVLNYASIFLFQWLKLD